MSGCVFGQGLWETYVVRFARRRFSGGCSREQYLPGSEEARRGRRKSWFAIKLKRDSAHPTGGLLSWDDPSELSTIEAKTRPLYLPLIILSLHVGFSQEGSINLSDEENSWRVTQLWATSRQHFQQQGKCVIQSWMGEFVSTPQDPL